MGGKEGKRAAASEELGIELHFYKNASITYVDNCVLMPGSRVKDLLLVLYLETNMFQITTEFYFRQAQSYDYDVRFSTHGNMSDLSFELTFFLLPAS